jgi:hypothetical protein
LYDRAFTDLELLGFSDVASVMSFTVRMASVEPGFPVALNRPAEWAVSDLNGDGRKELYLASSDTLFSVDSLGQVTNVADLPSGTHLVKLNPPVDIDGDGKDDLLFEGGPFGIAQLVNGSVITRFNDFPASRAFPVRSRSGRGMIFVVGPFSGISSAALFTLSPRNTSVRQIPDGSTVCNVESFPASSFVITSPGQALCLIVIDTTLVET